MRTLGPFLFSLYLWVVVALATLFFSCLILLSSLLAPFDPDRRLAHQFGNFWGTSLIKLNPFWRLEIAGLKKIRKDESYVIVANHASLSDIICLFNLNRQFKWLAKRSLFGIPFLGWSMGVMGYVPLERGRHGSIKKSYTESLGWLRRNISILIFPEGTRSRSGEIGPFKTGAFRLAVESQKPILPIVLAGTQNVISKGKAAFGAPGLAYVSVLSPIETKGLKSADEKSLRDEVASVMRAELKKRNRMIARVRK